MITVAASSSFWSSSSHPLSIPCREKEGKERRERDGSEGTCMRGTRDGREG